jgi:PAS domain S-box-containing protein
MRTMGLEQSTMAALTLQSFNLSPDLKSQLAAQIETVFVSKWPITSEFHLGTPLFGQQHYEYTLSPISLMANTRDSKQNNDIVLFRAKNITESKQVEVALKELDIRFHHLFESTDDSILILDAFTQRVLDANQNMSRRLGYTHQDLLKLNIEDIAPRWMKTIGVDLLQQLRSHGKTAFSHYLRHKDGTRISVEVHSYLVEYGDRLIIQSTIRDVETYHSLIPDLP